MTKAFHRAAIDVDEAVKSAPQSVGGSAFKSLGRNCPICAGMRNDCRQSPHGLVHCRSALAAAGWRYIGDDSIGFGMYSDRPAAKDSADFAARLEAAEKRKTAIAADKRAISERALSANIRDKQFTTIARHSGLSQSHRTKLEQRGYTPEQIERRYTECRLWTWADDADIPGLSSDLPGATADGKLRRYGAGMAIAVTDENQRILGAQVRGDSGYFWVSSFRIGGCSPVLKNGENPIGFYRPDSGIFAAEIDLDEGFLKSDLTAERHGRLVLGAAGGNFAASPEQFERYLAAAAKLTGSKLVILNADGGSQKNPSVVRTYGATAKLVESLGYEFRVRWWGQFEKADGDSDEIDSNKFNSAVLLSWADFEKFVPDVSKGFKARVVDGGKGKDEPELSRRDWAIDRRKFDFRQVLSLLEKDRKITRKDYTERDVAYYDKRTPEFSQALIDGIASTILIRGFLAAGKTHAAIESIRLLLELMGLDKQIIWISTRNGLLRQTQGKMLKALKSLIPIYHFQDDVTLHRRLLETGQPGIFVMTDSSFSDYHVGRVDWSRTLVFIDEWASVRAQVPANSKCFSEFKRMLSEAGQLVILDAFLGDVDCRIMSKFRKGARLILDQVPIKAPKNIRWAECRNMDGEISFSHDGIGINVLDSWFKGRSIEKDDRYILVTDSLLSAKAMQLYAIKECGLKESEVLLVCSQTVEESHQTMPDPDGRIRGSGAKLTILTPTAESGIDIQVPFTAGLAMFCGVLSGTGAMQLMGRARQCDNWIVSAPRRSINPDHPHLSEAKIRRILTRLSEALEESGISGDARSDGWAVWQREIRAVQSAFSSEYIYYLLTEHYESVEITEEFDGDSKGWIDLVREVKRLDAVKALTADLENGTVMVEEETPPSKDCHVWDVTLAKGHKEHPKLWDAAIADYHSGNSEKREDAIAWAKELLKEKQLASLKRYVQASDCDLDDDNVLNDRVARVGSNYSSPAFKQLQNQSLFRVLNLESLARMGVEEDKIDSASADDSAFDARSPKIQALWKKFKAIPRLVKLFPAVETVQDFWRAIKAAMRYFGFQAKSGTARAEREGKKPSLYFVGWVSRAESGSKFFVQNFDLIIESVRDRLEVERLERKRGSSHTQVEPPLGQQWGTAA